VRWHSSGIACWIDDSYYTYADTAKTDLPIVIESNNHEHVWQWIRLRKYTSPEPSLSSAGPEETAGVGAAVSDGYSIYAYSSNSAQDSYNLFNFTYKSTSEAYAILNFAGNLASDQYKTLALLAKLLSDAYSIRTFTSRTLLDGYAIISGIAVREVIVLNSKIARELNLTSPVSREILLRSKLN
jgi:hypothetical protein